MKFVCVGMVEMAESSDCSVFIGNFNSNPLCKFAVSVGAAKFPISCCCVILENLPVAVCFNAVCFFNLSCYDFCYVYVLSVFSKLNVFINFHQAVRLLVIPFATSDVEILFVKLFGCFVGFGYNKMRVRRIA
jgi:hypothetical protein